MTPRLSQRPRAAHPRMPLCKILVSCLAVLLMSFASGGAHAASADPAMEERFQDLFVTAGYCTAFGAAFGTALLAWTSEPAENLKYVAVGASMGFIGGSFLGSYVVFSPMIVDSRHSSGGRPPDLLAAHRSRGLALQPIWDESRRALTGFASSMTLATF